MNRTIHLLAAAALLAAGCDRGRPITAPTSPNADDVPATAATPSWSSVVD